MRASLDVGIGRTMAEDPPQPGWTDPGKDRDRSRFDHIPPQHSADALPPGHWATATTGAGSSSDPEGFDRAPVPPAPPPPLPPMVPPPGPAGFPPPSVGGYGQPIPVYASFGERFAAFLLDWFFLAVLSAVGIGISFAMAKSIDNTTGAFFAIAIFWAALGSSLMGIVYWIGGDANAAGQTLGRKTMGIRLVDGTTYQPIGLGRAIGRWFAESVCVLTLGLGYLAPLWTPRKQAFHDSIIGSVVIRDRSRTSVSGVVVATVIAGLIGGIGSGIAGGALAKKINRESGYTDYANGRDGSDEDGQLIADSCDTSENGQFRFEEVSGSSTSSNQLRIQLNVVDTCGVVREFTEASIFLESDHGCVADGYFTFSPHLFISPYGSEKIVLIFDEHYCSAGNDWGLTGRLTSTDFPQSDRGVPDVASEEGPARGTNPALDASRATSQETSQTPATSETIRPPDTTVDPLASGTIAAAPARIGAPPELPPATTKCGPDFSFDYVTANMFDRDNQTAWGTAGDASGAELVFEFDRELSIHSVGLIPGYAKVGPMNDAGCPIVDRFPLQRQITSVVWSFEDGSTQRQTFTASAQMQLIAVNESTHWVKLRIESTVLPVGADDLTFISEIAMYG